MNEFTVAVLNLFVTCISIAVSLPGIREHDLRLTILTFLVLFLGKLISSLYSYGNISGLFNRVFISLECIMDVIAISFCFHYVFVILNHFSSIDNTDTYSLFNNNFYLIIIVIVSAMHVFFDLVRCGVTVIKGVRTNKRIIDINRKG